MKDCQGKNALGAGKGQEVMGKINKNPRNFQNPGDCLKGLSE